MISIGFLKILKMIKKIYQTVGLPQTLKDGIIRLREISQLETLMRSQATAPP